MRLRPIGFSPRPTRQRGPLQTTYGVKVRNQLPNRLYELQSYTSRARPGCLPYPSMTLKLKSEGNPPSSFDWEILSPSPPQFSSLPSPPATWLSAKDMKLYGSRPLTSTSDIGIVRCKDCNKPVLRSFVSEHASKWVTNA